MASSACAARSVTTEPAPVTSASTFEQSADQVGDALSEVSLQLSARMSGTEEDLVLAWSDFEGDVRSVINDLIRNPSKVDIEGMQQRVEAFGQLLDDPAVELPDAEWKEFTSAFQTLIEEVSKVSVSNDGS
ncbi:MAG: hypothetical protein WD274_01400 [Acidimicrobiia bacterium]